MDFVATDLDFVVPGLDFVVPDFGFVATPEAISPGDVLRHLSLVGGFGLWRQPAVISL